MGFFGLVAQQKGAPQPAHFAVVDEEEALREAAPHIDLWRHAQAQHAPVFSGGIVDWPARELEAQTVLAQEWQLVKAWLSSKEARNG